MMEEEWRPVIDYEGRYEVSSIGNIRSIINNGKILRAKTKNNKYKYVALRKSNKTKYLYIHRLVAYSFIGIPDSQCDVDHVNRIRDDNRVSNLRWVTRSENIRNSDRYKNSSSRYYGVCWDKHACKWKANISIHGKTVHIGNFSDEKQAALAVDNYCKTNLLDVKTNFEIGGLND